MFCEFKFFLERFVGGFSGVWTRETLFMSLRTFGRGFLKGSWEFKGFRRGLLEGS